MLKGKNVLLCVSSSVAAYKAAELCSLLVKAHANVNVIMTENATKFISPITFESLTHNRTVVDTFDRNHSYEIEHIALADLSDVVMVAPATANVIAKLANGLADDMLSTTVLACNCPKIVAPAMNTKMYENPITTDNIEKLGYAKTLYMDLDTTKMMGIGWKPEVGIKDMYRRMIKGSC